MSDKRIEKTVQLIENAFFDLYNICPLEKISITKICDKANINRSTFYYHYVDYPAFLAHMEESIIKDYMNINNQYQYDTDTHKILDDTISYLCDNRDKARFLFRNGHNSEGVNRIKQLLQEKSMPIWLRESNMTAAEFELVFTYFINGAFALLEYYFKHPVLEKNHVLEIMDEVIKYGVYSFVYTK